MDWFKVKQELHQRSDLMRSILPKNKSKIERQNTSGNEIRDEQIDVGYEASWSGIVQDHKSEE